MQQITLRHGNSKLNHLGPFSKLTLHVLKPPLLNALTDPADLRAKALAIHLFFIAAPDPTFPADQLTQH